MAGRDTVEMQVIRTKVLMYGFKNIGWSGVSYMYVAAVKLLLVKCSKALNN